MVFITNKKVSFPSISLGLLKRSRPKLRRATLPHPPIPLLRFVEIHPLSVEIYAKMSSKITTMREAVISFWSTKVYKLITDAVNVFYTNVLIQVAEVSKHLMPYLAATNKISWWHNLAITLISILLRCFVFCRRECDADQLYTKPTRF